MASRLSTRNARKLLTGTDGASMPAWKRGGGVVSFFAGGSAQADRAARRCGPRPGRRAVALRGAAWLPDGSLLYAPEARGPIRRLRDGER